MDANVFLLLIILITISTLTAVPINTTTTETIRTTRESASVTPSSQSWLVNSAILALGLSPIRMNPICYTGGCQSDGYGLDVFKFSYTKVPVGTCINKIIPEHVTVS